MNDPFDAHPVARRAAVILLALAGAAPMPAANPPASRDSLPAGARARLGSLDFVLPTELYRTDLAPNGKAIGYVDARHRLTFKELVGGDSRVSHQLQLMPQARLVFAPDGKQVATADQNEVVVWNVQTGKRVAGLRVYRVSREQSTSSVAFSGDGKRLAFCRGRDDSNLTYVVLDVERDGPVVEIATPASDWAYLALSPDARLLATWGYRDEPSGQAARKADPADDPNQVITIWDTKTAKPVHRLIALGGASGYQLCFSRDGKTCALAGRQIEFWDTATWTLRKRVKGGDGYWPLGPAVAFSPDGRRLAMLIGDGRAGLWDTTTGERLALVSGHGPAYTLRFVDNERAIVLGGGENVARAWEVPSGKLLTPAGGHTEKVSHVTFTSDGKHLLSVSEDGVLIRTDVSTGRPAAGGLTPVDYIPWVGTRERLEYISPDGTRGVFVTYPEYVRRDGRKARVFDLAARKEVFTATRRTGDLWRSNLTCSARGTRLLLNPGLRPGATDVPTTAVWDTATGIKVCDFPQRDDSPNAAYLSPDDRFVVVAANRADPATGARGVTGEVWDARTGKRLATFDAPSKGTADSAGVSPDGRTLVVATLYEFFFFDLSTGRLRFRADPPDQRPESAVVFSADGRLCALGEGNGPGMGLVQVWEIASGSIRRSLDGHVNDTRTVAFSPDGRLLASGSADSTVVLWELERVPIPPDVRTATPQHLWKLLGSPEAATAYPAMLALASRPDDATSVIRANLKPVTPEKGGPAVIRQLIARLDARAYRDREAATNALKEMGQDGVELMTRALAAGPSAEAERRLKDILAAVAEARPTPTAMRSARAVEVLERVGTADAQAILRTLAAGAPGHALTVDARAALNRLEAK